MKTKISIPLLATLQAMSVSGAFNQVTGDSQQVYGDGTNSSIGPQFNDFYWKKKALIEAKKSQFFSPLASTIAMPKHFGKEIKQYLYLPVLDDRNINDQGIDATGATTTNGNLYGSSKDAGTIVGKLPVLSENGGRVNRVGFRRIEVRGTMAKFGFFEEYTQESLDFDTDAELSNHIHRETVRTATEITEDMLQIDLLNNAGVIRYGGTAIADNELTGNASDVISVPTYEGLMKLGITLDNNRTPKKTTVITGSRMVDTRTIDGARYMYIGTEIIPTLNRMKNLHDEPALVPARQYGQAGQIINGEYGAIDQFRFVVNPEMIHWAGAGKAEGGDNAGYRATGGNYDVFPMLVVGDGSFSTIGFQTDGKSVKFVIKNKKPNQNDGSHDPFGETGYYSIKWYYGFLGIRTERIALYKVVAEI